MSRTIYPKLKEAGNQLHLGATTSTYAVRGRIVPVTYPNPNFDISKPEDNEKNPKLKTELVPLHDTGIKNTPGLGLLEKEPLTFCLHPGCSVVLPTGVLVDNKEVKHVIRESVVGQEPLYHGKPVFKSEPAIKDLSQYFLGEPA